MPIIYLALELDRRIQALKYKKANVFVNAEVRRALNRLESLEFDYKAITKACGKGLSKAEKLKYLQARKTQLISFRGEEQLNVLQVEQSITDVDTLIEQVLQGGKD